MRLAPWFVSRQAAAADGGEVSRCKIKRQERMNDE